MNKENIKSFEDACAVLKLDPEKVLPDFTSYPENHRKAMIAHAKLIIIAEALNYVENGGKRWVPDWSNWDEYKYTPWFEMGGSSGAGFAFGDFGRWGAHSGCGSRLCYINREVAEYAGSTFLDLYRDYFVI